MGARLKKGAIYLFNCDLDGNTNSSNNCTKHFFMILSHENYNQWSNSYLGVGFSSNEKQPHIIKLIPEDFEGWSAAINSGKYNTFNGKNPLNLLTDKVCRLSENDLIFKGKQLSDPLLKVTLEKYEKIVDDIEKFMLIPNKEYNI